MPRRERRREDLRRRVVERVTDWAGGGGGFRWADSGGSAQCIAPACAGAQERGKGAGEERGRGWSGSRSAPRGLRREHAAAAGRASFFGGVQPPLCDIPSGCCFFTGPWTVTRSSLRMLRRVAAFCRPLRPVLLLVSFPRSRSPVVGVLGLC